MPRTRKPKLKSYVKNDSGELERVDVIDVNSEQKTGRKNVKTVKAAKAKSAGKVANNKRSKSPRKSNSKTKTKTDDDIENPVVISTVKNSTVNNSTVNNSTVNNSTVKKSAIKASAKKSGVKTSAAKASAVNTGAKKRKAYEFEEDDQQNPPVSDLERSSEIWKNYFPSRIENRALQRLIKKYQSVNSTTNHHQSKKVKISKVKTNRNRQINISNRQSNRPTRKSTSIPVSDDIMLGWVSATRTKNFLMGDMCLDWLNRYYSTYGLSDKELSPEERNDLEKYMKDSSHLELLFEGGNRFEDQVYEELQSLYEDEFTLVFDREDLEKFQAHRDMNGFIRTKYDETIRLMQAGMPIIAQAVMINDSNMTYGIADLLVRSDYLVEIFKYFPEDPACNCGAPKLGSVNYHYRVIDCKWTTMTLCVNEPDVLRNDGFFPAYKGQLAVYNGCLMQMQGYIPERAYIMAKAWKIGVEKIPNGEEHLYRGFSAFDRPGVIDYANNDNAYVERTKEAIQWVQRVMTEGREWRYGSKKPSIPELYPNMSKTYDASFSQIKSEIAKRYGEITQGWYVGVNHRSNAFAKGITDIRDPRMSLDVLGITSKKRGAVIQEIIDINKINQVSDLVRPPIILTNNTNWQKPHIMDYFVDFETITYNLFVKPDYIDIDNSYFDSGVTFMIGIGFMSEDSVNTTKILKALEIDDNRCGVYHRIDKKNPKSQNRWEFVCFYLTNFRVENELELFRLFFQFIIVRNCLIKNSLDIGNVFGEADARIFHWTGAELTFMKNAVRRMKSDQYNPVLADIFHAQTNEDFKDIKNDVLDLIRCFEDTVIWVDLFEEMVKEPVVVKGCYRFKLKHFANALHDHGLIQTNWGSTKMSDGLRAMFEAILIYRDFGDKNKSVTAANNKNFKEIIDYNEVDCRVMWEIIEYLRTNHTG